MVPGTHLKKQKTTEMAAANLPPRSPTKFTRQQVAKPTGAKFTMHMN
jgi:hypothetical protein